MSSAASAFDPYGDEPAEPPAPPSPARATPFARSSAPSASSAVPATDAPALPAAVVGGVRLVAGFEAGRRARAVAEAAEIRLMADAAAAVARPPHATPEQGRRAELDRRALVADLATSTRVSEWTVTRLMSEAADLCTRFAAGVDALGRGEISRQHLAVIHDTGDPISDDAARAAFLTLALDRATTLTPGRLAPVLKVIAERFQDRTLAERHTDATARRGVEILDLPDHMAALTLINDATLIHGIHDRLTAQARAALTARQPADHAPHEAASGSADHDGGAAGDGGRGDGGDATVGDAAASDDDGEPVDSRTMTQLRADIATDLLLTAGPQDCVAGTGLAAIRATVQITIPVLTMTGTSNEPCLLAGYGPIDPDTARALAAGTPGWERVMTCPVTGAVLAVDRYRPGPALDRFLAARDEHCRFPGCRRPVWHCDIDHTIDHAHGGPTSHDNLAHLCRRHHTMKHLTPWTVQQTAPGILVWTSPTGRAHTDRPEPVIRFTPNDDETQRRRQLMREPWLFTDPPPPGTPGTPPF